MKSYRRIAFGLIGVVCLAGGASTALAGKDDWKPVEPALLSLKTSVVERDADAEGIFWEVQVQDEVYVGNLSTTVSNYIRIKIFTQERVQEFDVTRAFRCLTEALRHFCLVQGRLFF